MTRLHRRAVLQGAAMAGAAAMLPRPPVAHGSRASSSLDPYAGMVWGRGFEGQRTADLGDGTFLDPVFAGDHPGSTILRDGKDYYLTFFGFQRPRLLMHRCGLQRARAHMPAQFERGSAAGGRAMRIRLTNARNILTIRTSVDGGRTWQKFDVEVSGNHLMSLMISSVAAGSLCDRCRRCALFQFPV